MQYSFREPPSRSEISALDWRTGAIVLAALIWSQGCGAISLAPDRSVSTNRPSLSETGPAHRSDDKPPTHAVARETPPATDVPTIPETEQVPPVAKIPTPAQPTTIEETGLASWYGPGFHGKLTASGEVFNQEKFTAAHPTLPWGSWVKVTNLENGKSVEVRINDRGPFKRGRIIDLSRAAARALGMLRQGITKVRVEWLSESETSNELVLQDR